MLQKIKKILESLALTAMSDTWDQTDVQINSSALLTHLICCIVTSFPISPE